ncbi:hypothetical protein MMAD_31950 [Mycolicibacterium madagascariense]|uniref:DoxX family protein n=1 Tax=Mycolicibacterium madagascariense TaxID=212765 RepID=A0A7I7XI86_9MYCO|nr:hypothetical protein [Mycolicibacterium madagascariense]MCV7012764.1 hypothetical protein [Mycolicibacterium madagascariense]BBZ28900.1 hypothetical protein MMAD_31950 [Mycolicibacterium madagascariense]
MDHRQDTKTLQYNSMFLGVFMFVFGVLKYFPPFRTMFDVQITESHLPRLSIPLGKVGEMAIGGGLLLPACFRHQIPNVYRPAVVVASSALVVNMGVATYVHLQPEVPANVLPLGIKAPFIPLSVMFLAIVNIVQACRGEGRRSPQRH